MKEGIEPPVRIGNMGNKDRKNQNCATLFPYTSMMRVRPSTGR